ncbi:2-polyprenylphenol 6-hydroxylase [Gimibacter soli]|uniref:2-polyprenylphenol 6-hydroxylase n=1 Tax=Gimibacter soli TaxID=3024400 RepID=A0AAE9XNM8_9PROT|nr:2-polyprenylphenol 6-hydroxylase [Gimibacter soli]WCL54368.1 2-polyprenylphenol 6-hydroxylase [Gimibacter soli]
MIASLRHLFRLYGLAVGLRRYGALRALAQIETVPPAAPGLLRALTFFIPRRRGLPDAAGERLALALAAMGPTYIKIGQTLATRPDLVGRPLAEGLATLQDSLPPFPFKAARATIEAELGGKLEDHFSAFEETPVAAASIAQVHKAITKDGRTVAVKVLRPGIEARFSKDLALFSWLAGIAEANVPKATRLRPVAVVAKLKETVLREMDLRLEASAAAELADNMAGEDGYRVPQIDWDRTSRSVMTQEWADGIRLGDRDALVAAGHDLEALSARIAQIFLRQAMHDGYFHADLHQGNLIVEPHGGIVAVDFGIMGRLSKHDRRFLAEILYGFIARDYRRVAEVHFDAGYVPANQSVEEFTQALRAIADPIMDLPVEKISAGKLLAQLFATTERFSMQTQPQLLLLQRSMVMAEGIAMHLNPQVNMWQVSKPVLEGWMRDNLSPEARIADFLKSLPRLMERLPDRIDRLLAEKQATAPTVIVKHESRLGAFALGLLAGAILLKLLLL